MNFSRIYGYWSSMFITGAYAIEECAPETRTAKHPNGEWCTGYTVSTEAGDVEGKVRVHRETDPGVFTVQLIGRYTAPGNNACVWDLKTAQIALQKFTPGLVLDMHPQGDDLQLTYDIREGSEYATDWLALCWAGMAEAVINTLKAKPFRATSGDTEVFVVERSVRCDGGVVKTLMALKRKLGWPYFYASFSAANHPAWDRASSMRTLKQYFGRDAVLETGGQGDELQVRFDI